MSTSTLSLRSPASPEFPEPDDISTDDVRPHNAYRMKMQGVKISTIAKAFRVSERTIHRWFAKYVDDFRESFESQPAANLIAEQLAELQEMQNHALAEAGKCNSKRDKNSFLKTALSAKSQIINLMLSTGVIPKTPERLYSVMLDEKRLSDSPSEDEKSPDELKREIVRLLQTMRPLV